MKHVPDSVRHSDDPRNRRSGRRVRLSYTSPCGEVEPPLAAAERMKAVVRPVSRLVRRPQDRRSRQARRPASTRRSTESAPPPSTRPTGTGSRARRTSRAPTIGIGAPSRTRFGTDYAGVVEAVGGKRHEVQARRRVFGARSGSMAEYVTASADRSIVRKPANITFEQAAAMPIAAITALQGLRDRGGCSRARRCLSTARRAESARSPCRSRKRSAPRSRASAAPETSNSCGRSAPITSSITRRKTSPKCRSATIDSRQRRQSFGARYAASARAERKARARQRTEGRSVARANVPGGRDDGRIAVRESRMAFFIAQLNPADLEVLAELSATGK